MLLRSAIGIEGTLLLNMHLLADIMKGGTQDRKWGQMPCKRKLGSGNCVCFYMWYVPTSYMNPYVANFGGGTNFKIFFTVQIMPHDRLLYL